MGYFRHLCRQTVRYFYNFSCISWTIFKTPFTYVCQFKILHVLQPFLPINFCLLAPPGSFSPLFTFSWPASVFSNSTRKDHYFVMPIFLDFDRDFGFEKFTYLYIWKVLSVRKWLNFCCSFHSFKNKMDRQKAKFRSLSCFCACYMSGTAQQHVQSFIYRLSIKTNVKNIKHRVTHHKTDKIIVTLIHEGNQSSSWTRDNCFMEEVDTQTHKQPTSRNLQWIYGHD